MTFNWRILILILWVLTGIDEEDAFFLPVVPEDGEEDAMAEE